MKILVAPLNWGLGHASRCVPLVHRFLDEGHEVILGGDGESLVLLRRHFPKLRYVYLAPLQLKYGKGKRQVWAVVKMLPKLVVWSMKDHALLKAVLWEEKIDRLVSDNRFGLYGKEESGTEFVYMTHQLHVLLPKGWKWLEGLVERLHARVCAHFDKVWVPDYKEEEKSLAGVLSHPKKSKDDSRHSDKCQKAKVEYIGPQSRFARYGDVKDANEMRTRMTAKLGGGYAVVAVLSGLEPQRTMLEQEVVRRYQGQEEQVLIVQGLMNRPNTRIKRGNITLVPYMEDENLAEVLLEAQHIIARSGYSTIMDLEALGLLEKAELIPTPGQPEQEYLCNLLKK
ncbi:MAG: hypothetical protein IJQ20_06040 [Paludibacteraceae bacterium]|nr:hypothetical protein [Paludibacteraceae bacterium]MBQ9426085.1 hypothetical protein [Paludibacteraceae bacterium]